MEARRIIEAFCETYRTPSSFGLRLLPFLERVEQADPQVRHQVLLFVERRFSRQARRKSGDPRREAELDRRVLERIAPALHAWEPPGWLKQWGHDQPGGLDRPRSED